MQLRNRSDGYGWVAILFHWLGALGLFGLFGLGLWMTGLDYYHPWYHRAPPLHRGLGLLVLGLFVARLAWRWFSPPPAPLGRPWERLLAGVVHRLFYLLVPALAASGYLISTADGHGMDIFGLIQVPSLTGPVAGLADRAGRVHFGLALTLMGLASLHGVAALKHQFIDRDGTLSRILGVQ